jgi:hypothetical protein
MVQANYNDKNLVVEILSKAFDSNKSVNYAIKQDKKRAFRLKKLIEYSFEECWHFGEIYLTDDRKGVALFILPYKKKTTFHSIYEDFKLVINSVGITRLFTILEREKYIKKIRPKSHNYLYVWYLGVLPEFQGSEAIKKMKDEIFKMADDRDMPIYIETSGEKQKNVYLRYGFEIYHVWHNQFNTYFMKREPK